jgi:hypothetical protein
MYSYPIYIEIKNFIISIYYNKIFLIKYIITKIYYIIYYIWEIQLLKQMLINGLMILY